MRKAGTCRVGLDYAYRHGDMLIRGSDIDHDNDLGVKNLWTRYTFDVEYGITDQFTAVVELPYVVNYRRQDNNNTYYESHGVGDLVAGGRYWGREIDLSSWNFYAEVDVRFPTGEDDQMYRGQPKRSYIQPGLGQWGLMTSAGFYVGAGDFAFTGSAGGVFNFGENSLDYDSADAGMASVGGSWTPLQLGAEKKTLIGISFYLSGIWIPENDERDGVTVGNTGGEWYYATPGAFFSPDGGNFTLYISFPVTLYADVHDLQCYEPYAFNLGMQYRF